MHPITWLRRSCLATIHELGITLPEGEHLYSNWDTELVGRRIVEDELPELYPLDENIQEAIDNLQENPIFLLSDRAQEPLSVEQINYVIDCPLYPPTSERGIGNLINVHELTPEQADKVCSKIQYSTHTNRSLHRKTTISHWMGGIQVKRTIKKCSGINACLHASNYISSSHTSWTSSDWEDKRIRTHSSQRVFAEEYNAGLGQKETLTTYHTVKKHFEKYGCGFYKIDPNTGETILCDGVPEVRHFNTTNFNGDARYYICCNKITNNNEFFQHYYHTINPTRPINWEYMMDLLTYGFHPNQPSECFQVFGTQTRRSDCGVPHHDGNQPLQRIECDVTFNIIVPIDLQDHPYILITSHGEHTHVPPPPSRSPALLTELIVDRVKNFINFGRGYCDIIASEGMNRLCQELNIEQLMNAHPAWNNKSKIQAIAMLEQIDRYPYGVEWAGVWYDYRANHYNKFGTQQYIRRMYNYGDRREIHCFYLDQALYLKNLDTFQIDTSYKRTAGKWREVIFAQYIEQENIDQLTQLSRVYTDVETAEGFYQLFKNWYRCINEALENADQPPLHFHHIHGNGIKAIVVDMCAKQANGWGCFLSDIDPQHRPWQFHIQSTMIYCLVHYQRGIDNSIIANDGYAGLLKDISIAKSKNDCYALLECVRQDYPDMMGWCTHKEWDWIISGLNEQFFLGDKATFRNCIRNTNAVEASGAQTNRYGKALSLAISIEKGRKHDLRINFGGRDNAILGVTNSWRGRSVYDRINERRKRSLLKQKKNQQFAQENNLLLSDDIPEEQQIHHQSSQLSNSDYNHSSSGRPPRIRRSRRQQSVPIQQQQSNITATLEESVRQADLRIQLANKELELKERQIEIARRDREIRELQCT